MAGEDREGDLLLTGGHCIPESELVEQASRSGGPGGQHVNTSSTRVTLRWNLRETCGLRPEARARALERLARRLTRDGELVIHADRHRSRHRNRQDARERLRLLVEAALVVQTPRRPTRPTRASKTRRLDAKRRHGDTKQRRVVRTDDD
ncbi:MAG: aminoacyl-tRNA hydrolase [Deltaproteobacteria bacterium]|nr:aminoacyl-tRNA hydrolase [Deltaproteobacteria bacterium]